MNSTTKLLIELALDGVSTEIILENVVHGSIELFRVFRTSEGVPSDEADRDVVTTYFDAYGDLRFVKDGVLIQDLSPMMEVLGQVVDVASADSGLVELMDGYEGTVEQLYATVLTRYHLVHSGD